MERDNEYLENKLDYIIKNHFNDVDFSNQVIIKFGKRSRRQLGCIRMEQDRSILAVLNITRDRNDKASIITITSYFKLPEVPDEIVASTIAHELVHYVHGFNSPLPRKYKHPHKGNIVHKELAQRGLGDMYKASKKWLKNNWKDIVTKN
ncbi:MAG TPA: hypothetical protein VHA74_02115 [Candidatus Dojkabacteria bacterium]|nr:hypothetical protein [Candidatus Dojkabacteria bacterium]